MSSLGLRFYPLWTLEEAKAARPYTKVNNCELSEDELLRRFDLFGGSARDLFAAPDQVRQSESYQDAAIQSLSSDFVHLLLGAAKLEIRETRGMLSSRIAGYECPAPFELDNRAAVLLSLAVRVKIWSRFLNIMWNETISRPSRAEAGHAFERYCYCLLRTPCELEVRSLEKIPGESLRPIRTFARSRVEVSNPEQKAAHWVAAGAGDACPLYVPSVSVYPSHRCCRLRRL